MKKKHFKTFITVVLVLVFLLSTIFNFFAFSSSYGSLIFKYDKSLFLTMHASSVNYLDIHSHEDYGIQIEGKNVLDCLTYDAKYYIDESSILQAKIVCVRQEENYKSKTTYYYKGDDVYVNFERDPSKSDDDLKEKYNISHMPLENLHFMSIPFVEEAYYLDITTDKDKTSIDFSFSPFYLLGIKYSYSKDDKSKVTLKYDLQGRVRKIESKEKENSSKLVINYKNTKIKFPDLTEYN